MHIIRRQILELELPREAGALALQRRASRVFQEQVLPRLDEVFSRIAPEGRHVRIERLELDLGDISEANWERDFVEKCVAQIGQQVAEAAFAVGGEHVAETFSAEENALAVFKCFLETGMLPWYAKHLTLKALEKMVSKAMASESAFRGQELRRILKEKPSVLQRLVWQFSTTFSEKMVETALGLSEGWVQQVIQIRQSQTGQKMTTQAFMLLAKHLLNADTSVLENALPTRDLLAQIFFAETPKVLISKTELPVEKEYPPKNHTDPEVPGSDRSEDPQLDQAEIPTKQKTALAKIAPEGIAVENAGLVLLAVYLPMFFKKLGIELSSGNQLSESSITNPKSPIPNPQSQITNHQSPITNQPINQSTDHQFRAVHLLHFLATGHEHPEEPQLVLPKILCGLALDTPIPQDLDLSEEDKLEANRLLEAIIRNWPVLKNTSPDGLRSAFIQRSGLLSWSESRQSWVLQVERLGQDLLLEKVPWSYSVIKLAWMEEMVQVEW